MLGAAFGIGLAVTTLAFLGSFIASAKATMTQRATASVAVDWQVQVSQPGLAGKVADALNGHTGVQFADRVAYLKARGLAATTSGSRQVTGQAEVLGLPDTYRTDFPAEVRTLTGADHGVLLAQQTAANLHAHPGSDIQVLLSGGRSATVHVDGIVDLPQADSLFQRVGAPPQSQPAAPPDNVVLVPPSTMAQLAAQSVTAPVTQFHVELSNDLPADPAAAYAASLAQANNLEASVSGAAHVGNNIGAALDAAREDAAYSQILFLFLGVPAAVLAALVTGAVASSGAARRRADLALLRLRGATRRRILSLAASEATVAAVLGSAIGLAAAAIVGRLTFGGVAFGAPGQGGWWLLGAALAGLVTALSCFLLPVSRDLRSMTVAQSTRGSMRGVRSTPLVWAAAGGLVALAYLVFWATSRNKYTLVLAPEGVPQLSVSYWAFAAPALLWVGAALLVVVAGTAALRRGAAALRGVLRSVNGRLAPPVAATIRRDAPGLARAATLVALAVAFALSAATFNATYAQQAEVDAQLTNGADVTVNRSGDSGLAAQQTANTLAGIPGVRPVEQMQHRFAYVGNDLQDLYGIDPSTIGRATTLQDAYFQGGSASQLMQRLQSTPSGVLVSAETVTDFNLHQGDTIRLRLRDASSQRLATIPFTYVGVANEFPTAPKDSFLVANASYVAQQTHDASTGTYLVDTATGQEANVAAAARNLLGPSALVTDINQTRGLIGSSLTSVDLHGLTRVELVLAVLLVLASSALIMGLGVAERRRALAVASVLGARRRQLTLMASSGAAVATAIGLVAGALLSVAMSRMLVKVLSGVFDPPPSTLAVPWGYAAVVLASAGAATLAAALAARWLGGRVGVADLRTHD